ncbi:MAG: SMI1/KNR4 family protein [Chloroflexi bacterium]|nr:SMI1/KNR4 family protein [Chloroflexota bacterium]
MTKNDLIARVHARASKPKMIHDMARSMSPTPKLFPPATTQQIVAAEKTLGFALPPVFKQLLTEIRNGGFGPGYGLFGVDGGNPDYDRSTLTQLYARAHSPIERNNFSLLPEKILPVCNWGCGIYSCLDCRHADAPVYFFNPELHVLDDENLEATVTDADGKVVWTYRPQIQSSDKAESKPTRLFLHKKSFEEWIAAWAKGVKLWDEMQELMLSF